MEADAEELPSPEGGGVFEVRHPEEKINLPATHTPRFQVPRSPLAPNTPLDTVINESQMPQVTSYWEHLKMLQRPEASKLCQASAGMTGACAQPLEDRTDCSPTSLHSRTLRSPRTLIGPRERQPRIRAHLA